MWAVTAVGLAMCAFPLPLISWLSDAGWLDIKLSCWPSICKRGLNSIRRTGSVHPKYGLSSVELLLLRKLPNCAARERIEADWDAEFHRRVINTPVHYYPSADGTLSRARWVAELTAKCRALCRASVDMIVSTARLEDWKQWWQSRAKWAPKGSSSSHKEVEAFLRKQGAPLDSAARAGKKSMLTTVGTLGPEDFLLSVPASYPRKSTKHEPGLKTVHSMLKMTILS